MKDNAKIYDNSSTGSIAAAGGVYVASQGTFQMAGGTIYGSGEASGTQNTADGSSRTGAALYTNYSGGGIAQYGTLSGTTFTSKGDFSEATNQTIKVASGVLTLSN